MSTETTSEPEAPAWGALPVEQYLIVRQHTGFPLLDDIFS
jgi:hypothetical protein